MIDDETKKSSQGKTIASFPTPKKTAEDGTSNVQRFAGSKTASEVTWVSPNSQKLGDMYAAKIVQDYLLPHHYVKWVMVLCC